MNAAFSMAMASVANLPEGTRYHIVIEGCDAAPGGTFVATARLVILSEETGGEKTPADEPGEEAAVLRNKKKTELKKRLEEKGGDLEQLEKAGMDLDMLLDIIHDQQIADEMIGQWFTVTELGQNTIKPLIQEYQELGLVEETPIPSALAREPENIPDIPAQQEQDMERSQGQDIYLPPVVSLQEYPKIKEKITSEIKTVLEEYMMEKAVNILSAPGASEKPGVWDELQRAKEIAIRELTENIISAVFRLGGSDDEQRQSLAMRLAENMILDGVLDSMIDDTQPQQARRKEQRPHIDTLDLVA